MVSTFAILSILSLGRLVHAHNWLTYPEARIPKGLYGSGPTEKNNCESDNTEIPSDNKFSRGDTIQPRWVWNNHWNGFARFSIVPLGQENSIEDINDPNNFIKISCHTQKCGGRSKDMTASEYDYYSPYNLPAQKGVPYDQSERENECSTDLTFPEWLDDGSYVLQWITYGVHDSDAIMDKALPFYRSCANIQISGGSTVSEKPTDGCAFQWEGGDKALDQPTNLDTSQCGYWKYNSINATAGYYNPEGLFTGSTEITDATAYRHGPPAEVLACNNLESTESKPKPKGSSPNKSSQAQITSSARQSRPTPTSEPSEPPMRPEATPASVGSSTGTKKCRRPSKLYKRRFQQRWLRIARR